MVAALQQLQSDYCRRTEEVTQLRTALAVAEHASQTAREEAAQYLGELTATKKSLTQTTKEKAKAEEAAHALSKVADDATRHLSGLEAAHAQVTQARDEHQRVRSLLERDQKDLQARAETAERRLKKLAVENETLWEHVGTWTQRGGVESGVVRSLPREEKQTGNGTGKYMDGQTGPLVVRRDGSIAMAARTETETWEVSE